MISIYLDVKVFKCEINVVSYFPSHDKEYVLGPDLSEFLVFKSSWWIETVKQTSLVVNRDFITFFDDFIILSDNY